MRFLSSFLKLKTSWSPATLASLMVIGATLGFVLMVACGKVPVVHLNSSVRHFVWQTPVATDRGALESSFLGYSSSKSYSDFRVKGASNSAVLVAGLYDAVATRFIGTGRVYSRTSGWAASGLKFVQMDAGSENIYNVALAYNDDHQALGMISDGATNGSSDYTFTQSVFFNGVWSNLRPFTQPTSSVPINLNTLANNPINGYASDMAFNPTLNRFYLAYVNNSVAVTSPDNDLYLQYYDYLSGTWGSAGNEILLSADASQVEVQRDGDGTAVMWLSQSANSAVPALGSNHTCVLRVDGSVKCYGTNTSGQVGNGGILTQTDPVHATGLDVTSGIAMADMGAGGNISCAMTDVGAVYCWGEDNDGEIGDSNVCSTAESGGTYCTTPTAVDSIDGTDAAAGDVAIAISVGDNHVCAIINTSAATTNNNGGFRCWGDNTTGQLGDGTVVDKNAPTAVQDSGTNYTAIAAGGSHTCGIRSNGDTYCWGTNTNGEVGDAGGCGDPCSSPVLAIANGTDTATILGAGKNHTCAWIPADPNLMCWGDNDYGQLGDNSYGTDRTSEVDTTLADSTVTAIAAGDSHTCVVYNSINGSVSGGVKCWGRNDSGQLGQGTTSGPDSCTGSVACSINPVQVPTFGNGITATGIGAYGTRTCVMTSTNGMYCWGNGTSSPTLVNGATDCAGGACIIASSSTDNSFLDLTTVSTSGQTAVNLDSDADGSGNVVVAYIQSNFGHPTCSSNATNCQYRVFASVRNIQGQWVGPTRLDTSFDDQTTTLYQNSGQASGADPTVTETGGVDYATPAVAYIGEGQFLVLFSVINVTNKVSGLYSMKYTVGEGWDSSPMQIEQQALDSTVVDSRYYRMYNDIEVIGGGETANAMIHSVTTNGQLSSNRKLGYKIFKYAGENWILTRTLDGSWECDASDEDCATPKVSGYQFSTGEAVFVYPAPATTGSSNFRLWTIEYR